MNHAFMKFISIRCFHYLLHRIHIQITFSLHALWLGVCVALFLLSPPAFRSLFLFEGVLKLSY